MHLQVEEEEEGVNYQYLRFSSGLGLIKLRRLLPIDRLSTPLRPGKRRARSLFLAVVNRKCILVFLPKAKESISEKSISDKSSRELKGAISAKRGLKNRKSSG